jgi:hypothetical protein
MGPAWWPDVQKGIRTALRRQLIAMFVVSWVVLVSLAVAEEAPKLLGDESDGSRALPIHVIPLFAENEQGEKGGQVDPNAEQAMPFSTQWTCGECHSYGTISRGWHFNATDSNVPAGRPGEPWLYYNSKFGIQLPLSYRPWPGTFEPNEVGLTPFKFTKIFGRHMPGGGPGAVTATDPEEIARQYVSGKLEVNCLACHNAHPGQDQGGPTGYAVQVSRENYRWAAAASCEFAAVTGSAADMLSTYDPFMPDADEATAPRVKYDQRAFDGSGNVFMQIVREIPNYRCYYCHSDLYYGSGDEKTEKWSADEDIHLTAGLKCVDCHRNGLQHDILRGYDEEATVSQNVLAATTSCRGCHLGDENGRRPEGGRLGAPVPKHAGIPTVHFERLSCTACHSGPWPGDETTLAKTSRAHRLGTPSVTKDEQVVPHILAPVFVKQAVLSAGRASEPATAANGRIAPHKLIWPAYWGRLDGERVKPLAIDVVEGTLGRVLAKVEPPANGSWASLTDDQIAQSLKALAEGTDAKTVYVAGGRVYRLDDAGQLVSEADRLAAAPYAWPIAHNVRPAAQSLGVGKCTVCHSPKSAFFFGKVGVDSPAASGGSGAMSQYQFQRVPHGRTWAFAMSFAFRPWFKIVSIGASALIALVLLLYGLRALGTVVRVLAERE